LEFEVTASRVRELRLARELTQGDVAVAMGVSRQTINSIEMGKYVPSLALAIGLARFFGLPVEEIFHVDKS
jgi:putative transcriptional regulator